MAADSQEGLAEQVIARFGVLPNFFRPPPGAESLVPGLWAFTRSAYLDNPLPSLFKERLFVHLSRFCEVRYCIVRHACFLAGCGHPAGDGQATPQRAAEIVALLRRPVPRAAALGEAFGRLESMPGPTAIPEPGTRLEADLFDALAVIFLNAAQAARARAAVTTATGNSAAELLLGMLAFIRTAHYWTEIHPDLSLEPDAEAFLDEHRELAGLLTDPADAVAASPRAAYQRAAADLVQAQESLAADREAQQRAQRDFVANAAHELRTPLTAVIAAIETLDRGAINDPSARDRFFTHIRREASRLSRLCDSLLLLAEAQSGAALPMTAVDVQALLAEIAADLHPAPGVTVTVDAPAALTVTTNRGLLERVLANLAHNAVKYTASGQITLRATITAMTVMVEVRDTGQGLGLPADRAVERFSRGGARTADGFGLGLSIARQAALAIGAALRLQDNPGGGTLAMLTLPPAPSAAARVRFLISGQSS